MFRKPGHCAFEREDLEGILSLTWSVMIHTDDSLDSEVMGRSMTDKMTRNRERVRKENYLLPQLDRIYE
jgi:hypothetical protein